MISVHLRTCVIGLRYIEAQQQQPGAPGVATAENKGDFTLNSLRKHLKLRLTFTTHNPFRAVDKCVPFPLAPFSFFFFFSFLFGMFLNRVSRVLFHTFDDGDYQLIISDRYSSHFVISIGSKFTEPENTRAR